ncbi:MAG TPA: hypothetical protein VE127_02135, partial [Solirubrobacteraceae bacterium]|nr:hypothetical protein [Solirubrobacteraceae bacterium]
MEATRRKHDLGAASSSPTRGRFVALGPWSRWLRDWVDLFRLSFAVSAIVLAVIGNGEAWRMGATFFLSLLPRIFATPWP